MKESICIFLEQYYLPKRYRDNIENFVYNLSSKFIVDVFSPEIDINLKYNSNYSQILKLRKVSQRTSACFSKNYDILILFSGYMKELTFDRRLLIAESLGFSRLYIIPGVDPFVYDTIDTRIAINLVDFHLNSYLNLENSYKIDSIFSNIISYSNEEVNIFKKKYNIENKLIAIIPGPIDNWLNNEIVYNEMSNCNKKLLDPFLNNLEKIKNDLNRLGYQILGIRHYKDDYNKYNNLNIKWVDEQEYNLLKFCSSAIITISNDNFFRYLTVSKPIINIGLIPYLFNLSENNSIFRFLTKILKSFYMENKYNEIEDIGYANFIEKIIQNNKFNSVNLIAKYIKIFENNNNEYINEEGGVMIVKNQFKIGSNII